MCVCVHARVCVCVCVHAHARVCVRARLSLRQVSNTDSVEVFPTPARTTGARDFHVLDGELVVVGQFLPFLDPATNHITRLVIDIL